MKRALLHALLFLSIVCTTIASEGANKQLGNMKDASLFSRITDSVLYRGIGRARPVELRQAVDYLDNEQALNDFLQQAAINSATEIIQVSSKQLNDAFALCARVYIAPAVSQRLFGRARFAAKARSQEGVELDDFRKLAMEKVRPILLQLTAISKDSRFSDERAAAFELVRRARVRAGDECACDHACIADAKLSYHESIDYSSPVSVITETGRRIVVHIDEMHRGAAKYPS